jgi:hypothetical protein
MGLVIIDVNKQWRAFSKFGINNGFSINRVSLSCATMPLWHPITSSVRS